MLARLAIVATLIAAAAIADGGGLKLKPTPENRPSPPSASTAPRAKSEPVPGAADPGRLRLLTPSEWQGIMEKQSAAAPPLSGGTQRDADGVALAGYDPVAYFRQQRAVPGKAEFSVEYLAATFRFSTAENKLAFERQPETYIPRFGGYCAYHVAKGKERVPDPRSFRIVSGRLYLFERSSIRSSWDRDANLLIPLAERLWPTR